MLSCSAEQSLPHTDPCWAPKPLDRLHSGNDAAAYALARRYPVILRAWLPCGRNSGDTCQTLEIPSASFDTPPLWQGVQPDPRWDDRGQCWHGGTRRRRKEASISGRGYQRATGRGAWLAFRARAHLFATQCADSAARRHVRQARNGLSCISQSLILNGHPTRLTSSASSNRQPRPPIRQERQWRISFV